MFDRSQQGRILQHLSTAKEQWEDENVATPGATFEDYVKDTYARGVQGTQVDRVKPRQTAMQRYMGYFGGNKNV